MMTNEWYKLKLTGPKLMSMFFSTITIPKSNKCGTPLFTVWASRLFCFPVGPVIALKFYGWTVQEVAWNNVWSIEQGNCNWRMSSIWFKA